MTDLINMPSFKKTIEDTVSLCKKTGNSVSITVCSADGKDCYVASDANGEDVAFMMAEQIFSYCKEVSLDTGVPIAELAQMTWKELSTYLNLMIDQDTKQMALIQNPIGEA